MSTVRVTESELARDVHAVLEKVRQGVEVIVDQDHRVVAVIKQSQPAGRKISEVIAELEACGANAVLDEEFARHVRESIQTYRKPWKPPPCISPRFQRPCCGVTANHNPPDVLRYNRTSAGITSVMRE